MRVLVAEANAVHRAELREQLEQFGHRVETTTSGAETMDSVRDRRPDVVLLASRFSDVDGPSVLETLRGEAPATDVIMLTDGGSFSEAVSAIKAGAADYLGKPVDTDRLGEALQRIAERKSMQSRFAAAQKTTSIPLDKTAIVGRSEPILKLFQRMERIAASDAAVLVKGESGTGKELVARWLHQRSPRGGAPFVAVNCAALPETLIEAELFGHEKGAYTGATRARKGRFQLAHGGTLFLDEVAEVPLPAQAKLLRVLQEREIEPLGGSVTIKVDVRIVSATHRDLKARIRDGLFREDLFYRLKVLDLIIPPLRQRPGDLRVLAEHFLKRFSLPGSAPALSPSAWAALSNYDFPGNVRELEHAIQHAVVMAGDEDIDVMHLPTEILGAVEPDAVPESGLAPLATAVREFEREYLRRALVLSGGNKTQTARLLGISRKNLWEKLKSHELS